MTAGPPTVPPAHDMDPAHHVDGCQFKWSASCAVGVACEHGFDVCATCDPCTCSAPTSPIAWRATSTALPGEADLAQWLGAPAPRPVSMLDASTAPACLAGGVDAGAFEDAEILAAGRALGKQHAAFEAVAARAAAHPGGILGVLADGAAKAPPPPPIFTDEQRKVFLDLAARLFG